MVFILRKYLLWACLISFSHPLYADKMNHLFPGIRTENISFRTSSAADTAFHLVKGITKICSCQILVLQISQRRQRHFVLFAEKTNKKSYASDLSIANKILEKEKKHMQSYFYDKLEVEGAFSDAIDCRSMFKRLKNKNKSIYLYDILDADIRR